MVALSPGQRPARGRRFVAGTPDRRVLAEVLWKAESGYCSAVRGSRGGGHMGASSGTPTAAELQVWRAQVKGPPVGDRTPGR